MRNRVGCLLLALTVLGLAGCLGSPPGSQVLRVGTSGDYQPFSKRFSERAGQSYRGFDIDVAQRFASESGRTIVWVPFRWPELIDAMDAGRFDVAMSGVTVRPERSVRGRFTLQVAETGAVLLIRESAFGRLEDPSLRVAVNAGGHLERVTRARFRTATISAIPNNGGVRAALAEGAVDAVVTDTLEAPHWRKGLTGIRSVGPFTRDRKAYWVRPGAPELAAELDAWLVAKERDGTLAEIRARWFPADSFERATVTDSLLAACDERLALMPAVAEYKREAGLAVVDAAREAKVLEAGWRAVERAAAAAGVTPPSKLATQRFYRAQIDAAVAVQRRVLAGPTSPDTPRFDLAVELRPALLRIGERIAWLLAQPPQVAEESRKLRDSVETALEPHALQGSHLDAIADALADIAASRPGQ